MVDQFLHASFVVFAYLLKRQAAQPKPIGKKEDESQARKACPKTFDPLPCGACREDPLW
jgi:hypothetical protein